MKKHLSAFDLLAFGVGATIGSGIFALTGTAAAGQVDQAHDIISTPLINFILHAPFGREGAGPAIVISFLVAAIACGFAALCYAELAAMIPVSGSAYTFAYASLGEVVAWIIGWDLILEYAVGNIAVAVSWSDHFFALLSRFVWPGAATLAHDRHNHGPFAQGFIWCGTAAQSKRALFQP